MKRVVDVLMGETQTPVGKLRYGAEGGRETSSFEYGESWLAWAERFEISPELPLMSGVRFREKRQNASIFFGCFADVEPDGWGRRVILRDAAKRRKETGNDSSGRVMNSLDFLLWVDDFARVGSLRFRDENGVLQRAVELGQRSVPPLIELKDLVAASHAVERNTETAADLRYLLGKGTSVGGLRPKASVLDDDGALCIGKFPSVKDDRPMEKGEVLALRLAALAGIDAAQARVVDADGEPVALVRRFDRTREGRLLYVSARTLMGVDDDQEHAYTEIAETIRMRGNEVAKDLAQLWRRIVYSVLITNADDHLNNHGFLHVSRGKWRLSPAFDINPFPDRARVLKTWISEETGPVASVEAALSAARYFGLHDDEARRLLGEVDAAVGRWREVASEVGMTADEAEQFANAFEHEERRFARQWCRH